MISASPMVVGVFKAGVFGAAALEEAMFVVSAQVAVVFKDAGLGVAAFGEGDLEEYSL